MASNGTNGAKGQPRKSIIVTGGASGIGLALTRHFASEGHQIAVLDINARTGAEVVAEVASEYPAATLTFKTCDVSSWDQQASVFEEVFKEHGNRIDVVMANAGISEQGSSSLAGVDEDKPSKPQLKVLDVNLLGTIYTIKLAIHYMKRSPQEGAPSRSIICTASNAGIYPFPVAPLYAASKSGVIGLVRSMAKVLEKHNIQINALAPAVLDTNIAPSKELVKKMIVTPMTTLTKGVAQLIADRSLTGQVAEIHGESVTLRPPHDFVDADSAKNLETFWSLGYA